MMSGSEKEQDGNRRVFDFFDLGVSCWILLVCASLGCLIYIHLPSLQHATCMPPVFVVMPECVLLSYL